MSNQISGYFVANQGVEPGLGVDSAPEILLPTIFLCYNFYSVEIEL